MRVIVNTNISVIFDLGNRNFGQKTLDVMRQNGRSVDLWIRFLSILTSVVGKTRIYGGLQWIWGKGHKITPISSSSRYRKSDS